MISLDALYRKLTGIRLFEFKAGMGLDEIGDEYSKTIEDTLTTYSDGSKPVTKPKNEFKRAVNDAFYLAVIAGWIDGGGDGPLPAPLITWLGARVLAEIGFVNEMFVKLKALRSQGDKEALGQFAQDRAEGYTNALVGIYAMGKAWALKDEWGTWRVGNTEHCPTCIMLNGKRKKISWFIKNDYIPRQAGSPTLKCKGYKCKCGVYGDDGRMLLPK